ncbi:MAG: riboflavin synthase [Thermoanaerobaculia bacterium]|nr:riboflavin synthase [Thermoanaerobaculia bacterium]
MFTGIVRERGVVTEAPEATPDGGRLVLELSRALAGELELGASLSVSGVCLTVVELDEESCAVDLSPETLDRTTLGELEIGREVNLEPALRVGDRLGGHLVQGHVDTVVELVAVVEKGENREMAFRLPPELERWVVEKGSVALDGISLTVARLEKDRFWVAVIPHTLEVTNLGSLAPGVRLNLEVDLVAKYVESLLVPWTGVKGEE